MHGLSSFSFFATSGLFRVYELGTAKLLEEKQVDDLQDGSLRFMILDEERALMAGNQGTTEVSVSRTAKSISLVEETGFGNKHVFTVFDEWDEDARGYRATYVRTVRFANELLRTTYSGYVRQ